VWTNFEACRLPFQLILAHLTHSIFFLRHDTFNYVLISWTFTYSRSRVECHGLNVLSAECSKSCDVMYDAWFVLLLQWAEPHSY